MYFLRHVFSKKVSSQQTVLSISKLSAGVTQTICFKQSCKKNLLPKNKFGAEWKHFQKQLVCCFNHWILWLKNEKALSFFQFKEQDYDKNLKVAFSAFKREQKMTL
jgi:hypothetical protein